MKLQLHQYSRIILSLVLLFLSCYLRAQDEQVFLKGHISIENNDLDGIHVQNKTANKATITDVYGFFSISAQLNDTVVFSAIHLKEKTIVIDNAILKSAAIVVPLEAAENKLEEVVVMPYSLTGDLSEDIAKLELVVVTETTLELPNASAKIYTQADRQLYTARSWEYTGNKIELDPIMNYFSGRTKMLNERVERNLKYKRTAMVTDLVTDSTFVNGLKIPKGHIMNFIFYCEADESFDALLLLKDHFKIWKFLLEKSVHYRAANDLE